MPSVWGVAPILWVPAALLLVCAVAVAIAWHRSRGVEDPIRITTFLEALDSYDWTNIANRPTALDGFRQQLLALFDAEVRYYYSGRKRHRLSSSFFRVSGWLFATLGVVLPVIAAQIEAARPAAPYGYVCIVISGCLFGGNQLFGGTAGHIRYVSTQYEIEAVLVSFTVEWEEWRATHQHTGIDDAALAQAFGLLKALASRIYEIIGTETGGWATAIQEANRRTAAEISGARDTQNKAADSKLVPAK